MLQNLYFWGMKRILISVFGFLLMASALCHPLHLSITNIVIENGSLKVILKTFPDDWETAYFHYKTKAIDLSLAENRSSEWFTSYLEKSFQIRLREGQDAIKLHTDSVLHEGESMTIELSAELSEKPKTLYIYQSLLTDIYPDQTNLVIVVNGKEEFGIEFDVSKHDEKVELR